MESKAIQFTRPQQVAQILGETAKLKLQVLIRISTDGRAVRGHVYSVDFEKEKVVRIAGVSDAGLRMLGGQTTVQVEFVLLSKKVYFVTRLRSRAAGQVLLDLPAKVVAIERRQNMRFRIPSGLEVFLEIPSRYYDLNRFDAPFIPDFLREEARARARIRVLCDDISLGGVAVFTRYPAIVEQLRPELDDVMANIQFIGAAPITVPISMRWTKRTMEHVPADQYVQLRDMLCKRIPTAGFRTQTVPIKNQYHRVGIQFAEVSSELDAIVRGFIRKVQVAESI